MITSKETLALISIFKNPILDILTDIKADVQFYFDTKISEYIENIREKLIKTKTFLYRHENIDFYDVYFPITLRSLKRKNYQITDIEDLFKETNFITILGNAGSGKTMLVKHIFLATITQIVKIPIIIELRNLNDYNGNFVDYINYIIEGKKLTPNSKILEKILSNGEFLFLLDGYDEIFSDKKNKITSDIIDFVDNHHNNYFIITSRPGANIESIPRFDNYYVNNLNKNQIIEFINKQLHHCEDIKLAEKIINVVNKPENNDYKSYLSSPLLLSMFIMTFNSYPELPKSKSKFYWNVYDTLCTKHNSFTKHGGFQHERKTGLQSEDFECVLKWFSYHSFVKGRYSFDNQYITQLLRKIKSKLNFNCTIEDLIEDLTVAIPIIVIDGIEYKFPHRSLQEYFAALLIKELPEETKKEIYLEKLPSLARFSFDRNENLWSLCNELDSIYFQKYFILIHLEEFIQKIDFSSKEQTCRSFLKYLTLNHIFILNTDNSQYVFNKLSWSGNISLYILEYYQIFKLEEFRLGEIKDMTTTNIIKEMIQDEIADKVSEEGEQNEYNLDYTENWNSRLYLFIIESGIENVIIRITNDAKEKIDAVKYEIEIKEKTKLDLLEL